jgi:hypothetical protein
MQLTLDDVPLGFDESKNPVSGRFEGAKNLDSLMLEKL